MAFLTGTSLASAAYSDLTTLIKVLKDAEMELKGFVRSLLYLAHLLHLDSSLKA